MTSFKTTFFVALVAAIVSSFVLAKPSTEIGFYAVGTGAITLDAPNKITAAVTFNESADLATLVLVGPSTVYYSVAFGSKKMADTWALVITGDAAVVEYSLGADSAGDQIESSFGLESNTVSNNLRTVVLSRSMSDVDDLSDEYFPFDMDMSSMSVCYAFGDQSSYSYHGDNFGDGTLHMSFATVKLHRHQKNEYRRQKEKKEKNKNKKTKSGSSIVTLNVAMGISALLIFVAIIVYGVWKYYQENNRKKNYYANNGMNDVAYDTTPLLISDDQQDAYQVAL